MAEQSLKEKTVKGTAWTTTEMFLRYGVSFIVGIILARLLSPDEYGLIGILSIFITIFEIIIDGGFANALIRKQDAKDIDYSTVFYTNLVLSLAMAGVLFACARPIAHFFERNELIRLTQAMSPIIIINALAIVQRVGLTKKLDFKTQAIISFISAIVSGGLGIFMAYKGYGVWALVAQQLSNAGINTIMLWVFNRWWPGFYFSWNSFREMWNFGWKLLAGGLLNTLSDEIHSAVIGKIYAPATLGQYTRARQFGSLLSSNISNIVAKVSYPVLSTIQDDTIRLKFSYQRLIKTTVLPTFVLMMGLCAMAKPLLLLLIGPQWNDAAIYLQILCFIMMMNPLHRLNISAILVTGRSDLNLRINVIKNLLMVFPVLVGIFTNIYWMLVADLVKSLFCYFLNTYYSGPLLSYPIKEQFKDILPSFLVAVEAAIPVYLIGYLPFSILTLFPFQFVLWCALVLLICENTQLEEYKEIKGVVASIILKYNGKVFNKKRND